MGLPEETEARRTMNVRRLPGFMYHYKVASLFLFTALLLVVYLLLHWGIMCTNLEAWRHVSNVVSKPTLEWTLFETLADGGNVVTLSCDAHCE